MRYATGPKTRLEADALTRLEERVAALERMTVTGGTVSRAGGAVNITVDPSDGDPSFLAAIVPPIQSITGPPASPGGPDLFYSWRRVVFTNSPGGPGSSTGSLPLPQVLDLNATDAPNGGVLNLRRVFRATAAASGGPIEAGPVPGYGGPGDGRPPAFRVWDVVRIRPSPDLPGYYETEDGVMKEWKVPVFRYTFNGVSLTEIVQFMHLKGRDLAAWYPGYTQLLTPPGVTIGPTPGPGGSP